MTTHVTRPSVHSFLVLACVFAIACDAEVKIGDGIDGSLFDDAGNDATVDEDAGEVDAGNDASMTMADAGTDANVPPDVSQVPQALAEAFCAALVECEGQQLVTDDENGENCAVNRAGLAAAGALSRLADSVADGRIVFDMDRLDECVAAIEAQACNVRSSRRPAVCEEAIDGKVALGGDCVISEDCSGTTSYCRVTDTCPGECAPLLNAGDACTATEQCANGLVCEGISGSAQCVAPGDPGDNCTLTSDSSDALAACKRGTRCTPNVGDDPTCKSVSVVYVRQNGQTCDPTAGSFCDVGLACTNTPSGLTCAPIAARDGACFRAQPSQCPAGQYCDAMTMMGGTCRDLPEEGETCLPSTRSQRCAPGFVCLLHSAGDVDDECTGKVANGDGCSESLECYSGSCNGTMCVTPSSVCTL